MPPPPARRALAARLRATARLCARLASPLSALLLDRSAHDVERGGPAWRLLEGHEDDPPGSVIGLRLLGSAHRLVLLGSAPRLAARYPSAGGEGPPAAAWAPFRELLEERREELRALLERPVQTNEVARSAALVGGFLTVAAHSALPLRVLEIGASAGLNLRWDRFRYEDAGGWGDPTSPVRLSGRIAGGRPPFHVAAEVVERRGCDLWPVDALGDEGLLTLRSYTWADQLDRLRLLDAAVAVARAVPAAVERAGAAEWLEAVLAEPVPGTATVVVNSAMWQYLEAGEQARVQRAIEAAGARASGSAPLAWLRLEPGQAPHLLEVRLTSWPEGTERRLATTDAHGRGVLWLGS